jgi:hypothetical protein
MVFIGSALKLPFLLIRRDVPQFLWLIISSVLVTLIVAILLFDVKRKKQALSYLKNKQPWHILLGYFVAISALYPLFTRAIYNVVGLPKLISTTKDVAMLQIEVQLEVLILVSLLIFLSRMLNKIDLKLGGVRIGEFIAVIYLSELVWQGASTGYYAFFFLEDLLWPPPNLYQFTSSAFFWWGSLAASLFWSILDIIITKKFSKNGL